MEQEFLRSQKMRIAVALKMSSVTSSPMLLENCGSTHLSTDRDRLQIAHAGVYAGKLAWKVVRSNNMNLIDYVRIG